MIKATVISTIDQAMLSALSFALSFLLIHFAGKQEYGLYAQLINLQSFFSPLHAGVFVSAFLAIASKLDNASFQQYRVSMARSEIVVALSSCLIVVMICIAGGKVLHYPVSSWTCVAFSLALLGLWWREFIRQLQFATMRHSNALKLDVAYCSLTICIVLIALFSSGVSSSVILWSMAAAAITVVAIPLVKAVKGDRTSIASIRHNLAVSWEVGRWEVLGSILSWTYAQSYVYFASFHGGLDAAAEISAGRLLATPLALLWPAYANVLRPSASRLLAQNSSRRTYRLAIRSTYFVAGCCLLYCLIIYPLIPFINKTLMGGKFVQLQSLAMWWIVYISLTGISSIAASILRSALRFRQVFTRQIVSCATALALLTVAARLKITVAIIIAMIVVELISIIMLWKRMKLALDQHQNATPSIDATPLGALNHEI